MGSHLTSRRGVAARCAAALIFAALVLGALTGGASAETNVERETTKSARATFTACVVDGDGNEACGEGFLDMFNEGKLGSGPIACLQITIGETFEEGCAEIGGAFDVAKNASSASLSAAAIDLFVKVCEGKVCDDVYSRTVTVEATWSAAGRAQRVHERLSDGGAGEPCSTHVVVTGWFQPATAAIVLDGSAADGTGDVQVLNTVTRRSCK